MFSGGCHCGAVKYEAEGDAQHHAICHCRDCRHAAGAPIVGWIAFKSDQVRVTKGTPKIRASSETGRRHFCPDCGTGMFYTNDAILPGIVDIQSATLDEGADGPSPSVHIQFAEHLEWIDDMSALPKFDRYPG